MQLTEQQYERLVTDLERKYATQIDTWARAAVIGRGTDDQLDATDFVEDKLTALPEFARVTIADISDIAYEAVSKAFAARWR